MNFDWDDLRLFLAIARAGSLAGASRTLGVNHSTVFRRLKALEAAQALAGLAAGALLYRPILVHAGFAVCALVLAAFILPVLGWALAARRLRAASRQGEDSA